MAVSVSFFLAYTASHIREKKLDSVPVTVRCELRYTLDALPWALSRRLGGQEKRVKFNLPAKVAPRYWRAGRARHPDPSALATNTLIEQVSARAQTLHAQYVAAKSFPPEAEFIGALLGAEMAAEKSFYADFAAYIEFLGNSRKSHPFINQMKLVRDTLTRFERSTGYRVDYESINRTFAAKFVAWCEQHLRPYRPAQDLNRTARKYLDDLKIFLSHALTEGWTKETLFRQIKISFKPNPFPTTLSEAEIDRLMAVTAADLAADRQQRRYKQSRFVDNALITRDWFVFATQTGMRYSDWQASRFRTNTARRGGQNIVFIQEKTDNPLEIPLSSLALSILERYAGVMPPDFSPAATGDHLRALARVAGIDKHITTHTARRTFCTLQEQAGVPRAIIMRISGHRTEKDYLRYIGVTFEYNADALRRANPAMFRLKKAQ